MEFHMHILYSDSIIMFALIFFVLLTWRSHFSRDFSNGSRKLSALKLIGRRYGPINVLAMFFSKRLFKYYCFSKTPETPGSCCEIVFDFQFLELHSDIQKDSLFQNLHSYNTSVNKSRVNQFFLYNANL